MQNQVVGRLGVSVLIIVLAGGCELQGPIGTNRIDAKAVPPRDSGPSHDWPADLQGGDALQPSGWAIKVGGDGQDTIWEVALDSSGSTESLVVLGRFSGAMKLEGVKGEIPLTGKSTGSTFIAKLDTGTHKWIWAVAVDGTPVDPTVTLFDGLGVDAAGNIYHAGKFSGSATFGAFTLTAAGDLDIFVTKRDPGGKVLWAVSAGGPGRDGAAALSVGSDSKVTIGGSISGTASFKGRPDLTAQGNNDLFVARLQPGDGRFDWAVRAGSDSTAIAGEYAMALAVDGSGNSTITGSVGGGATFGSTAISGTAGESGAYVAKIDPTGTFLWASSLQGTIGNSIALAPGGDPCVVTGGYYGAGTPVPGQSNVLQVVRGYWTTANTFPPVPHWEKIWQTLVIASGMLRGLRVVVDGDSTSVVAGTFTQKVEFGPKKLTSAWTGDTGFVAFLDLEGEFTGAERIESTSGSAARGLARDSAGGLYVVGTFQGTANIGGTVLKSQSASAADGFVWYSYRGLK